MDADPKRRLDGRGPDVLAACASALAFLCGLAFVAALIVRWA